MKTEGVRSDGSKTEPAEQQRAETDAGRPTAGKLPVYRDLLLLLTISGVLLVDQLSKVAIRSTLRVGESWPAEGLVRITHGTNTGTAFGLLPNQTLVLIVSSVIAIAFLVYYYRTHALPSVLLRFAIGLLLGGAVGNLVDRIRVGAVVDFIDLGPWPIFNVADSSIVVGIALLIGVTTLNGRKDEEASRVAGPATDSSRADSSPGP